MLYKMKKKLLCGFFGKKAQLLVNHISNKRIYFLHPCLFVSACLPACLSLQSVPKQIFTNLFSGVYEEWRSKLSGGGWHVVQFTQINLCSFFELQFLSLCVCALTLCNEFQIEAQGLKFICVCCVIIHTRQVTNYMHRNTNFPKFECKRNVFQQNCKPIHFYTLKGFRKNIYYEL